MLTLREITDSLFFDVYDNKTSFLEGRDLSTAETEVRYIH